jgi:hypothetical protein
VLARDSLFNSLATHTHASTLQRTKPTDLHTIQPLLFVLRNAGEFAMIQSLLEAAAAANPEEEDVGRQLCFAYVKAEDYRALQAVR